MRSARAATYGFGIPIPDAAGAAGGALLERGGLRGSRISWEGGDEAEEGCSEEDVEMHFVSQGPGLTALTGCERRVMVVIP